MGEFGLPAPKNFALQNSSQRYRGALCVCYFFLVQERSNQESEPGRSLRGLPASRRSNDERRGFLFCKRPPSAGHISHSADGFALARIFAFCVVVRSYCEPSARAERFLFLMTLLATRQEVSRKRARPFPPGPPRHPTAKQPPSGFLFCKSPPSAGHISHPADGFAVGKIFCYPVFV